MKLDKNTKRIALTFDDGPSITTPQILDILETYKIAATFFLIGQQVTQETKPILERQLRLGCELANHSFTHSDMSVMEPAQIQDELNQTSKVIKDTVNYDVKYFRPPYIALSDTMYETIDYPFIQGIGCRDWEPEVTPDERTSTILKEAKDGTIILLHDFEGNQNTVQALPAIIEGLQSQGCTFVTLTRLFTIKQITPNIKHKIWTNVLE